METFFICPQDKRRPLDANARYATLPDGDFAVHAQVDGRWQAVARTHSEPIAKMIVESINNLDRLRASNAALVKALAPLIACYVVEDADGGPSAHPYHGGPGDDEIKTLWRDARAALKAAE